MSAKTLMTVEEFAQMKTADTEAYELVDGELVPLSSPTPKHGRIRRKLERALEDYFGIHPIGDVMSETDCRLGAAVVRRPDVMVYLGEKVVLIDPDKIPIPFAPDIALEILSPSEGAVDLNRKVQDYLNADCHEVWVIDHSNGQMFIHTGLNTVRVLRGGQEIESLLLPGFSVHLRDLFA